MSDNPKEQAIIQRTADELLEIIEAAPSENWKPPFELITDVPRNAQSQKPFSGATNTLLPTIIKMKRGYPTNEWATYKQWTDMGAQVRKGEKSIPIIRYVERLKKDAKDETDTYRTMMVFSEFNAAQVDGYTPTAQPVRELLPLAERLEKADEFIKAQNAAMTVGAPAYWPTYDLVSMPMRAHFTDTEHATADEHRAAIFLHELGHRTGHATRLNRDLKGRFGDDEYAAEEMRVQWAAMKLSAKLGVYPTDKPSDFDAHYLKSWFTEGLRKDPNFLIEIVKDAAEIERYMTDQHERYLENPSIIDTVPELPEIEGVKRPQAIQHESPRIDFAALRAAGKPQTVNIDRDIHFDEPGKQWTDREGAGPDVDPFEIPNKVWGAADHSADGGKKVPDELPEIIHDKVPEHQKPDGGELENPTADGLWIEKPGIRKEPETVDELLETPNDKSFVDLVRQSRKKADNQPVGKGAV